MGSKLQNRCDDEKKKIKIVIVLGAGSHNNDSLASVTRDGTSLTLSLFVLVRPICVSAGSYLETNRGKMFTKM